jgi:L-gulonate 3-dehydrogenase
MKAAIIGAGLIGRAWAIVFARGGANVSLLDLDSRQCAAAMSWAQRTVADMAAYDLIDNPAAVLERISIAGSLEVALAGASHVQENIIERAEPKQALFQEIEKLADPATVLASSSSAIMPSVIFGDLKTRSRCLVAHPLNPPHLAPIVELSGAAFTVQSVIEKTSRFMRSCGMVDVIVQKEVDGFILNRLQYALLNEALRLIDGGYVSVADLDKTLKDGLALRWSFMGPIETIDLNAPGGIGDYMQRYGATIRHNVNLQKQSADWRDNVIESLVAEIRGTLPSAHVADAQALRDKRLMALARFKKNELPS